MTRIDYDYRSGIGSDLHRLVEGRKLLLGGVEVPFPLGLLGHSDGDVVLHSVIDAMLGAAGLGDIGMMFPDTDERWKDIDSRELLDIANNRLEKDKWEIVNIDIVVSVQEPRLGPFKGQMKRSISSILGIDFANVNVKAKTGEGLGEIGTGKAIAAQAIVLLRKRVKRLI